MSNHSIDDAPLSEHEIEDNDSDFETKVSVDPMRVYLNRNLCDTPEEEHQKIEFQKGMLFENIGKFIEVLRDYVIQEGFDMVRLKNERTRETCKYAADRYLWRIYASPLGDDITFAIT